MFRELLGVCMMVAFVMGTCQIAAHGQSITVTKTKPVGELVAKLKSQDEFERDEAMYELVKLGKAAVPALIGLVDDATGLKATPPEGYGNHYGKNVRGPLGWRAIGVGKQYYPVGLTVNRLAIRALGLIGDDRAVEALQEQAKKSSEVPPRNWSKLSESLSRR
jgi:HEAT repeat protein